MFGWTAAEVIGKPLPTIPDSERETFRELLREQTGGERIAGRELVRQRKDGSLIHVSLWTAPLTDSGGNLTGVLGIFVGKA
jgi:PAS domain S-box-containing protein